MLLLQGLALNLARRVAHRRQGGSQTTLVLTLEHVVCRGAPDDGFFSCLIVVDEYLRKLGPQTCEAEGHTRTELPSQHNTSYLFDWLGFFFLWGGVTMQCWEFLGLSNAQESLWC